jgi:hypothetical protein
MPFSHERQAAIKRSISLGRQLNQDHPELLTMYRSGSTLNQISEKLELCAVYNVTPEVARGAVSHALRGHKGQNNLPAYAGLASPEELDRLTAEHKLQGFLRADLPKHMDSAQATARSRGVAIYGIPKERLRKLGRAGGGISGKHNLDRKIGIFSLKGEELSEVSRMGVIASGKTPWMQGDLNRPSELDFALMLSEMLEYRHQGDKSEGRPNWRLIAETVNQGYHQGRGIRTVGAVIAACHKMKQKDASITVNAAAGP